MTRRTRTSTQWQEFWNSTSGAWKTRCSPRSDSSISYPQPVSWYQGDCLILAFVHSILLQRIKQKQIDDLHDVPNCLDNISYCRHFCQDRRSQQEKVRFHPCQRDECFWAVWLTESVTRSLLESVRTQKLHPLPVLCDSYRCTMETREWANRTQLFSKGKHFFSLSRFLKWVICSFCEWGRAEWLVRFQLSIIAREGSRELKKETRAVAFSTGLMQPLAWHSHLSAVRIAVAQ